MRKRNLLLIAMPAILLFASCKKDKDKHVVQPNTFGTEADNGNVDGSNQKGANVNYQLTAGLLDSVELPSLIAWTVGYINVTQIHFEANLLDSNKNKDKGKGNGNGNGHGNGVTHVHYKSDMVTRVNLLDPTALGNINIPYGTYRNAMVKVQLAPSDTFHTMHLEGIVEYNGLLIPVTVMVDETVDVMAKWKDEVTISAGTDYWSHIMLHLDQLTTGLDITMLQNLTITNGRIIISANSNAHIYQILLNNMKGMLKVKVK